MKLEPNEQRQRKFIKILINSNSVDGRTFLINKKFYDLFPFDWEETNFIINTLKGKKLVSLARTAETSAYRRRAFCRISRYGTHSQESFRNGDSMVRRYYGNNLNSVMASKTAVINHGIYDVL